MKEGKFHVGLLIGPLLGALAAIVYGRTLSVGAYPGEFAILVAQYAGLTGIETTAHPFWGWLVNVVLYLAPGELASRMNMLSVFCGGVAVFLFYEIIRGAIFYLILSDEVHPIGRARWTAILAGSVAALFLAFSVPFWVISNRAHFLAFDFCLLFGLTLLLMRYLSGQRMWILYCFALLYSVCLVEFSTLLVLAPLFATFILFVLWRHGQFRAGVILPLLFAAVVGLGMYLWVAWLFSASDSARLFELQGFGGTLWEMIKLQYRQLTQSLPRVGWLLVGLVTIAPWLVALLVARRGLNDERDRSFTILHVIMTIVLLGVLFDTRVSPWSLVGFSLLLVMPYVLAAATFGYLAAYWALLPSTWWQFSDDTVIRPKVRVAVCACIVLLFLGMVGAAAWLNISQADARPAGIINSLARDVVKDMQGRTWLITVGEMDANIQIAAADMRIPVKVINRNQENDPFYMKYIASLFDDPRLKSMTQISMYAFMQEWLTSHPEVMKEIAVLSMPDFFFSFGVPYQPNRTVYWAMDTNKPTAAAAVFEAHQAYWNEMEARLKSLDEKQGHSLFFSAFIRSHLSKTANNLGVWLEDQHQGGMAFTAYGAARAFSPDNISALLNQYVLLKNGLAVPERDEIIARVDAMAKDTQPKQRIWSLARTYGFVRMPEAFLEMGLSWTLSGQSGLAVLGLKEAIRLRGEDAPRLKQALAAVLLDQSKAEESARMYKEILAKYPGNPNAIFGLARVRAHQGQYDEAEKLLKSLEKRKVSRERLALEKAQLYMQAGQLDRAHVMLQELVEVSPHNTMVWTLLGTIAFVQKNEAGLKEALDRLASISKPDFASLVFQGEVAMERRQMDAARRYFDQANQLLPGNIHVLTVLLQLDVMMKQIDLAEIHVRQILEIDPQNAQANYVLGTLQAHRQQFVLAENSFRNSIKRERLPAAMADLAWLIQARGELDEAESLVREALSKTPDLAPAWDTLGVILMKRRQWPTAEESFLKAAGIAPNLVSVQLHLADLYLQRKQQDKARKIIEALYGQANEMSAEDREEFQRLRHELGEGSKP